MDIENYSEVNKNKNIGKAIKIIFEQHCKEFFKYQNYENLITEELWERYNFACDILDDKFIEEILTNEPNKVTSSLWELILACNLKYNNKIKINEHKNYGPDWLIDFSDQKFYIEAVCAHPPKNEGDLPLSRISNSISVKTKKHKNLVESSDYGYVLCIYTGSDHTNPLGFLEPRKAIRAVYPDVGDPQYDIKMDKNTGHSSVISNSLSGSKDHIKNPKTEKITRLSACILGNPDYKWISAILLSTCPLIFLLNAAKSEWREGINNNFVLCHNPNAKIPLAMDLFNSRTILIPKPNQNIIEVIGANIFPKN